MTLITVQVSLKCPGDKRRRVCFSIADLSVHSCFSFVGFSLQNFITIIIIFHIKIMMMVCNGCRIRNVTGTVKHNITNTDVFHMLINMYMVMG